MSTAHLLPELPAAPQALHNDVEETVVLADLVAQPRQRDASAAGLRIGRGIFQAGSNGGCKLCILSLLGLTVPNIHRLQGHPAA